MTKKELIAFLEPFPDDILVVKQSTNSVDEVFLSFAIATRPILYRLEGQQITDLAAGTRLVVIKQ